MKNKRWLLTASAVLVALAVMSVFCFKGQYLLLKNSFSGKALLLDEIADGEEFSVSFLHSVNKSPVTECYEVKSSKIYLMSLRYRTFGAGMPTYLEDGQSMRIDGDEMVIEGFDRDGRLMEDLCYSIGRVAMHTLKIHDKVIPLNTLDEPGQPVTFSVISYSKVLAFLLGAS